MTRVLLTYVLPIALPIAVYLAWAHLARKRALAVGVAAAPGWRDAPWTWLFITGIVTLMAGLMAFGWLSSEKPGGTYIPPQFIDGEVVPGRIER